MRYLVMLMLASVMGLGAVGCSVTPQQEMALGAEQHGTFEQQSGGIYNDPAVQGYVSGVGMSMAKYAVRTDLPDMKWQFHVLASDEINAFAVPGGYVYITQGLLFKMQNEAQLAGVLGHECGHIALRHSAKSMETQQGVGIATAGVSILAQQMGYDSAADATKTLANLGLMKYSRAHETEADYAGLDYMTRGGYNPTGMVQVMQTLKAAAGDSSGPLGDWTSTHPDPGNRVEYLSKAIKEKYSAQAKSGKYGEAEFKAGVLSRKKVARGGGEGTIVVKAMTAASEPAVVVSEAYVPPKVGHGNGDLMWCATCRAAAERKARGQMGKGGAGELLRSME